MPQTLNIAELLATFLKENYGLREAETALEQARLVDDIHTRLHRTVGHLIFRSHNQEGDSCRIKHFGETSDVGDTGDGNPIELIPGEANSVLNEILKGSP